MTDEDKQWLEKHGFIKHAQMTNVLQSTTYRKESKDASHILHIFIQDCNGFWIFHVFANYKEQQWKFSHNFFALTDENLECFIFMWNSKGLIDMLVKLNDEYSIPDSMKN